MAGYLAPAAGLIGISKLEAGHSAEKIGFGSSALTELAEMLVEIGLANETDWISAKKLPSTLVDHVLRQFLADHGQPTIAEHFELCLTLGDSIVDTTRPPGWSKDQLESVQAGLGEAFYDSLRQSLYRWVRVYDDWDARERTEQMAEWAEGEDDGESYEMLYQSDSPYLFDSSKFAKAFGFSSTPYSEGIHATAASFKKAAAAAR